jgi:hypothetical protein
MMTSKASTSNRAGIEIFKTMIKLERVLSFGGDNIIDVAFWF